jgi:hypothetical protein
MPTTRESCEPAVRSDNDEIQHDQGGAAAE